MAAESPHGEAESVRHLVALGYVDPNEVAARQAGELRQVEGELRRAVELIRQNRTSQAIPLLDRLAAEHPDSIAPRQLLAEVHFRAGNSRAARPHLDWLAHHNVVTPRLAEIEGAMALERRDLAAALEELEYACHADPTASRIRSLLGTVLLRLGRWDAARQAFEEALGQNRADAVALDGMAALAIHLKDFEDAAHWALEALDYDMQFFRAHYHLGIALAHMNRMEAAAQAFMACARLAPSRAAPLYWLSRIAGKQQETFAAAAEYRDQARQLIRQRRRRAKV